MKKLKFVSNIFFLMILLAGVSIKTIAQSKITDKQIKATFDLFWGSGASSDLIIDKYDKDHAFDLLNKLTEGSCSLSIINGIHSFNGSLLSICKRLYTRFSGCNKAIKNGRYAESVRKAIALEYNSAFEIRKQTGEW